MNILQDLFFKNTTHQIWSDTYLILEYLEGDFRDEKYIEFLCRGKLIEQIDAIINLVEQIERGEPGGHDFTVEDLLLVLAMISAEKRGHKQFIDLCEDITAAMGFHYTSNLMFLAMDAARGRISPDGKFDRDWRKPQ